jgi:hypothetical protein
MEDHSDSYYEVFMNTEWIFDTARTPSRNAIVSNSPSNSRTVFIEVVLAGTEQLVYSSPYIPLGGTLTNFALNANLPAGEHPAVVTYFLVDDAGTIITDVSVSVKLIILA